MSEILPNRRRLVGQSWETIETESPAILWPLFTPTASAYVAAESEKADATATNAGRPYTFAPVLHGKGRWRVYYNASGTFEYLLIHIKDPAIAAMIGTPSVQIIGATGGVAEVKTYLAMEGAANTFLGLLTQSQIISRVDGGATVSPLDCEGIQGLDGLATSATRRHLSTGAVLHGRNSSGNALALIEAMPDVQSGRNFLGIQQMRAHGYYPGFRSRKFTIATGPNVAFPLSTNAFAATDPSVLITPPATNEWILRRLRFRPFDVLTAGTMRLCVVVDPDARYSSGGTSFIPTNGFQATNLGSPAQVTPTQARTNSGAAIVASAADNDEWFSGDFHIGAYTEDYSIFEFEDGLICPPSGTILIYYFGAPTLEFGFALDIESANIQ